MPRRNQDDENIYNAVISRKLELVEAQQQKNPQLVNQYSSMDETHSHWGWLPGYDGTFVRAWGRCQPETWTHKANSFVGGLSQGAPGTGGAPPVS